jgi:phage/plasmid-like protein (TIGR03299 family)
MPDRVSSMMWNRQNGPPWHDKGVPVEGLATAAECIRTAGLDWGVAKFPLKVADEGGLPVPGKMVTVRTDLPSTDPRRILGVVGEEYQPLQNWDAFGFFDHVVGNRIAIYETAGAIENGKRIWLLARLPVTIQPVKGDEVNPYLLLANGHDGSLMVHLTFTPIRVVCQNTLAMALVEGKRRVAIRHDRSLRKRLEEAAVLLGLVNSTLKHARDLWRGMATRSMTEADAERYFRSVFGGEIEDEQEFETADQARRPMTGLKQRAMENFESDSNRQLHIQGTLWAAYNATIWAVDWERKTNKDRVDDLCLGEGARIKERARQQAELILVASG